MSSSAESTVSRVFTPTTLSGSTLALLLLGAPVAKDLLDTQAAEQRRMSDKVTEVRDATVELRMELRELRLRIEDIDALERAVREQAGRHDRLVDELDALRRCVKNRKECG